MMYIVLNIWLLRASSFDLLKGFWLGSFKVTINYLMFVDDNLIFSKDEKERLVIVFILVNLFKSASGINLTVRRQLSTALA